MSSGRGSADESTSGSVGLLMSILVRYPEVSSIKFDPDLREIRIAFTVGKLLSDAEFASFWETLRASLDAYAFVTSRDDLMLEVERRTVASYTVVEIARDVETLCQEEISLVIALVQGAFGTTLVVDEAEPIAEDDADAQDGVIDQMLDNLNDTAGQRRLIGFREDGRVMVFNRAMSTPD